MSNQSNDVARRQMRDRIEAVIGKFVRSDQLPPDWPGTRVIARSLFRIWHFQ